MSPVAWSVLAKAAGRLRDQPLVNEIATAMLEHKILAVDGVLVNSVTDACVRIGDVELARSIVETNWEKVGTRTLNILLRGMCARGHVNAAFEEVDKWKKRGVEGDHVTRNVLVEGCVRIGWVDKAMHMMNGVEAGEQRVIGVTSVVGGLAGKGQMEEARNLVNGVGGGEKSWAVLIGGLVKARRIKEAIQLCEEGDSGIVGMQALVGGLCADGDIEMVEMGRRVVVKWWEKADIAVGNLVLGGYVKMGRMREAHKWLRRMERYGMMPDVTSFTMMGQRYTDQRRWGKGMGMFVEIAKRGMKMDRIAMGAFVTNRVRAGDVEMAERLVGLMEERGGELCPSGKEYAALIWGAARKGDRERVWKWYGRMKERKLGVGRNLMETLMEECVKEGRERRREGRDVKEVVKLGVDVLREGRRMGVGVDALREARRRLVSGIGGGRELRVLMKEEWRDVESETEKIFRRHGWNAFDSGWRVL